MMQNLLLAAIGPQGADRNVSVGQPLESSLPAAGASAALVLQNPDGHKEQIRIAARGESNRWSYGDTSQSGIYRAEMPSAASQNRLYAVNINVRTEKRADEDRPLQRFLTKLPSFPPVKTNNIPLPPNSAPAVANPNCSST